MTRAVRRRHEAHVRASNVFNDYSDAFKVTAGWQKSRTALAACVTEARRLFARQEQSIQDRRAAAEQIRAGRQSLRKGIAVIVKVGKLVTVDETTMATLQIPRSVSDVELLACARGLLNRVTPYADSFVAEGLPPGVLQSVQDRIDRFVAAKDEYAAARENFTAASESIRRTQARADLLVDALEAIVADTSEALPEVLPILRMAKRVGPRTQPVAEAPPIALRAA